MEKKNLLHYINICQRDMYEHDLKLKYSEMAIYELFKNISHSSKCTKKVVGDDIYYQFSPQFIMGQLPYLDVATRQGIAKKIQKLIDNGLIVASEKTKAQKMAMYKFGQKHYEIENKEVERQCKQKLSVSDNESLQSVTTKVTVSDNESLHNNINNNKANNNNLNNLQEEYTPAFFSKKIDDLKEPTNPPKKERKGRGTLETYLQFVKLSKDEHAQFTEKYGAKFVEDCIEKLDNWIDRQTGAAHEKYLKQNHAACIRGWVVKAVKEDMERAAKRTGSFNGSSNRITSSQAVNLD